MKINQFNELLFDQEDILQGLYSGKLTSLAKVNVEDQKLIDQFNQNIELNADSISKMQLYIEPTCSVEEFDRMNQAEWMMSDEYKHIDIDAYLIALCKTPEERQRVSVELELFRQHHMVEVLKYLKYLVDYMREHKIVWGLGRGSSVASYCLYLIGIHKIDSIKYQLDIKEFLKGENDGKENL
jgi:DNA polymerase III alpha subunit